MATLLRNTVAQNIGITPTEILATSTNNRYTVIGLNIANTGNSVVQVSITLTDDNGNTGFYLKNIMVAPQSSLKAITNSEKLVLGVSNSLKIYANVNNSIDTIVSFVEIL
jgi:hypothetical protein